MPQWLSLHAGPQLILLRPRQFPAPALADAAAIWCDDNRWQVVARAAQLGLAIPSESNPAEAVIVAQTDDEMRVIAAGQEFGRITAREAFDGYQAITDYLTSAVAKYESGEWHPSGVRDDVWLAYKTDEAAVYARACQAAFDLR